MKKNNEFIYIKHDNKIYEYLGNENFDIDKNLSKEKTLENNLKNYIKNLLNDSNNQNLRRNLRKIENRCGLLDMLFNSYISQYLSKKQNNIQDSLCPYRATKTNNLKQVPKCDIQNNIEIIDFEKLNIHFNCDLTKILNVTFDSEINLNCDEKNIVQKETISKNDNGNDIDENNTSKSNDLNSQKNKLENTNVNKNWCKKD
jgi:hypothetical protein